MATVEMIWSSLQQQIISAMSGTNTLLNNSAVQPLPQIADDWPPERTLDAVKNGLLPTVISIFDRGAEKNITQAIPLLNVFPDQAVATPGSKLTPSAMVLPASGSITLTGANATLVNDAFYLTLMYGSVGQSQLYAEYTALSTDTLISSLTAFTGKINLLTDIVATLSGDVITVQNNTDISYTVRTGVTNIAPITMEGFRWNRDIQITVWSRTPADRAKYGNILEQLFSQLEVNYGFIAADQSACRVLYTDDLVHKDSQLQDIYRRDFLLQIDYPVLNTLKGYPIETMQQTYGTL